MENIKLNDGATIPNIGFGTWQLEDGQETIKAVTAALETGYRLIDTAKIYGNETSVGRAVGQSGLPRQDIFVTTKLWPSDFNKARQAFEESLDKLNLEYLDLYLIHWPGHDSQARKAAWQTLEKIKTDGLVKHIGVSNFLPQHLEELIGYAKAPPAVNQIEFHPFNYREQAETLDYCQENRIIVEAYSPLARAHNLRDKTLNEIAANHSKSPAQVMLRWAIQKGTIPIPKSAHKERIRENFDVFDFKLTESEIRQVDGLSGYGSAYG